ncbi:MAG: energy-coupling factor transport system substrate-specific component [Eubacteriaceae bacterium]|jgi:energy-coupling factor transport system substrate-specific component|nr:energy-coupling factor transport system substrate-specific component [Eubacteriaceae bacterium]MDK2961150.1 energy-coupling factor transport system substrate-specific component [Eubacteriaceae bacterium]
MKQKVILGLVLLVMIMSIGMGIVFLDDRKYLLISLVVLLLGMIPFVTSFERRKPQAREVVLLAVMAAIVAAGNLFFYMTAPFQAGTALVIIAGICLGPEQGFLVGAIARFSVNLFSGQGPWTPWQMFCWGLLGLLAGLCFNREDAVVKKEFEFKWIMGPVITVFAAIAAALVFHLASGSTETFLGWKLYGFGFMGLLIGLVFQRNRLPTDRITIGIFSFLTTFIVYGGIMNIAALVMATGVSGSGMAMDWDSMKILYISGVPYDAVHALAAAVFGMLLGPPMIEKLDRVKLKYGLYQFDKGCKF